MQVFQLSQLLRNNSGKLKKRQNMILEEISLWMRSGNGSMKIVIIF